MLEIFRSHKREIGAFIVALAIAGVFAWWSSSWVPVTSSLPDGILGIQFPGTRSGALAALSLLDQPSAPLSGSARVVGRHAVRVAVGLDFGFIAGYGTAAWILLRWVIGNRVKRPNVESRLIERFAPWAVVTAVIANVIQDFLIFALLWEGLPRYWIGVAASLTTLAALTKLTTLTFAGFVLVFGGLHPGQRGEPNEFTFGVPRSPPAESPAGTVFEVPVVQGEEFASFR